MSYIYRNFEHTHPGASLLGGTPPQNFKKSGKFGQFYKSRIFGRFNEHTPPIKVVSRRPCTHQI